MYPVLKSIGMALILCTGSPLLFCSEDEKIVATQFTMEVSSRNHIETYTYLVSEKVLRIDMLGEHKPLKPFNLIDRKTGDLTIIRPMNRTWEVVPAQAWTPPKEAIEKDPYPIPVVTQNVGPQITAPGVQSSDLQSTTERSQASVNQQPFTPQIPPLEVPHQAPIPQMPSEMDVATPRGIGQVGRGYAGNQSLSPIARPPSSPNTPVKPLELLKHEDQQDFYGYTCHRYTILFPRSRSLTIWASDAPDLPPYFELVYDSPQQRLGTQPQPKWHTLLRSKGLFPFKATLQAESEEEPDGAKDSKELPILRTWEIVKQETETMTDPSHFQLPDQYLDSFRR